MRGILFAVMVAGCGGKVLVDDPGGARDDTGSGVSASSEANCLNYCERVRACPNVEEPWRDVDCGDICAELISIVTRAGCDRAGEIVLECAARATEVCAVDDLFDDIGCDEDVAIAKRCVKPFCQANRPVCDFER